MIPILRHTTPYWCNKRYLWGAITINGKTYDHLGEVNDALKGIGNQIEKLNKGIREGTFSDDVLEQAEKLRSGLQKEKDRIQNILNKAKKAANGQ
ncbi:hypothetical protein [Mucilaginibacter pocheonensis]|uniref:Chromosome condensin MukBEF complex kleisin-like MukF subunit n=1 Tax=Mucilaginibacter pocheonensis TaxID=398050 RepID=A0ABU1TI97_9SPHI|nr:hypothetical protein [Mucilaginibacter pocheonensis]MDR6945083.1 chromosome condensin MukBEF complex kleisin-like MukF subunit [Mucilaginibacter pocheonensis]